MTFEKTGSTEELIKSLEDWVEFWGWLVIEAKRHGYASGGEDAGMDLDGWLWRRLEQYVQSSEGTSK